jgi:hypothetical protein
MVTAAFDGGLLGQDVDDGGIGRGSLRCRRAIGGPTKADQLGLTSRQWPRRIGAALLLGARISVAHRRGQRI